MVILASFYVIKYMYNFVFIIFYFYLISFYFDIFHRLMPRNMRRVGTLTEALTWRSRGWGRKSSKLILLDMSYPSYTVLYEIVL